MKKKILIVEDETKINQLILTSLEAVGYQCFQAFCGREAIGITTQEAIDLIILDIQLPDTDGFSLIKKLNQLPVIYLTARSSVSDKVTGLSLGAEDYLVKPFVIDELIARVQVVLRRFNKNQAQFDIGDLAIDLQQCSVKRERESIHLKPQEFLLLKALIEHRNMVLSREQLLQLAWGFDYGGDERTVDIHVQRIRKKLSLENYLKTVYKLGYRLEVE